MLLNRLYEHSTTDLIFKSMEEPILNSHKNCKYASLIDAQTVFFLLYKKIKNNNKKH